MAKIEIKDIIGNVIFEYEKENNTIKDTVEEAVKNCANLSYAYLYHADLKGVDLSNADLSNANLSDANLEGACLYKANLNGANLHNAILRGAKMPDSPMACPESGSFIGWKKVINKGEYLIKLEIPEDAERSSATTKKCRCSKAKVLEITTIETDKKVNKVINKNFCLLTTYEVGEMVYPNSFDNCRWRECSNGIHFFMDKQDALNY